MIRVCRYCSNVDVDKLEEIVGAENVVTGCIAQCGAYSDEAVAKINGQLVVKPTQEELFKVCESSK